MGFSGSTTLDVSWQEYISAMSSTSPFPFLSLRLQTIYIANILFFVHKERPFFFSSMVSY